MWEINFVSSVGTAVSNSGIECFARTAWQLSALCPSCEPVELMILCEHLQLLKNGVNGRWSVQGSERSKRMGLLVQKLNEVRRIIRHKGFCFHVP